MSEGHLPEYREDADPEDYGLFSCSKCATVDIWGNGWRWVGTFDSMLPVCSDACAESPV